jgi:hypothetical protein
VGDACKFTDVFDFEFKIGTIVDKRGANQSRCVLRLDEVDMFNLGVEVPDLLLNSEEAFAEGEDGSFLRRSAFIRRSGGFTCFNGAFEAEVGVTKFVQLFYVLFTNGDMRAFGLGLGNVRGVDEVDGGDGLIRGDILGLVVRVGRMEGRHGVMSEVMLREDFLAGWRLGGTGGVL